MKQFNTKRQGDVGLGSAIAYFTSNGITVSLPLTESQNYDLVIDINGYLKKVQVKTTTYKRDNVYEVMLKTCGGNQSGNSIKEFDGSSVDFLFILTDDNNKYLIPTNSDTAKNGIRLGKKYESYKV